jgi:hypothetical protein
MTETTLNERLEKAKLNKPKTGNPTILKITWIKKSW